MIARGLLLILALLVIVGCAPDDVVVSIAKNDQHPLAAFKEKNDDPIAAAADRYQRRLSADGTVPHRALLNAKAQRDLMLNQNPGPTAVSVDWDWVGPGNIGGRIRPIVIHPTQPDIIYVGSASGGIWKTVDGGDSWFPLDDFLPSLAVGDMVMHPADPDTLLVGTGEGFFEASEGSSNTAAVRGAGIFISNDAGTTWNQVPATDTPDFYFVNRLEFDPSDANTILAATGSGIWRSTDGGISWNLQYGENTLDVKFDPNNPLNVVAGGHHAHLAPYFSTDGGITWQIANGAGGHRQEMAWAPSATGTVYAAVSDDDQRIKIWRSTDNGQNYTLQTGGNGIQTWASYNNTIWVDPNNANTIILGGVRLFRSSNAGSSFSEQFQQVHSDMHRIVSDPGFNGTSNRVVYFATDGGIWRTNDVLGSNAFDLNNNLGITQFYGAGINPTTGNIIGGTQDNGTLFYDGNKQNWDHIFGGDGGYGAADQTDTNYFYGEVQRAYIHRSSNGGQSSSYIWNGSNPIGDAGGLEVNFIPFFMLDPNNPNRMLVCCRRLWRCNNVKSGSPDWFSIKDSIEPPGPGQQTRRTSDTSHFDPNSPYNLSTVAVAQGNADVVWAAHNNGELYKSSNGTASSPSWTRIDENGLGLPDRWISTIVIDPADHNHAYVALMGWHDDNLWKTADGGDTWVDVSGTGTDSIPNAPISAFAVHPVHSELLLAGTDVGMFYSNNNGQTWSTNNSIGPAAVPVEQLKWKNDDTLMAVTHGRGIYLGTVDVPESVAADSFNILRGLQAGGGLADIESSDDSYLQFNPGITLNSTEPPVWIEFFGTFSSDNPASYGFTIESRATTINIQQTIEFFNYVTDSYEQVDASMTGQTDMITSVQAQGDVARFVEPVTGQVQVRVGWKANGPILQYPWTISIDQVIWTTQ